MKYFFLVHPGKFSQCFLFRSAVLIRINLINRPPSNEDADIFSPDVKAH